ncbi:unnamed protein product [Protopolystoma xenopodis]|uniref:Uncharacterized protein n=1 Tax=Protopolystoma xenopodis TaxID=117903 RepID=A0A3S5CE04_9PLAT|nr:unnamed protein product [Protopolystoma xenopodis]
MPLVSQAPFDTFAEPEPSEKEVSLYRSAFGPPDWRAGHRLPRAGRLSLQRSPFSLPWPVYASCSVPEAAVVTASAETAAKATRSLPNEMDTSKTTPPIPPHGPCPRHSDGVNEKEEPTTCPPDGERMWPYLEHAGTCFYTANCPLN